MKKQVINFSKKFEKFSEKWAPKIIARMNDYHFKLVRVEGHFTWHVHEDTDEAFIVLEGELGIDLEDGNIILKQGELFIVPKGVKHKPFAKKECKVLLIEPIGVINTGNVIGDQTAPSDIWI